MGVKHTFRSVAVDCAAVAKTGPASWLQNQEKHPRSIFIHHNSTVSAYGKDLHVLRLYKNWICFTFVRWGGG